jgi:acyl-CoA reductase-like NAD-dependent aldehyde dehydrogenase
VIVHADADIDAAIPLIATGAFAYAGQSCISVQRILVQRSIYDAFRDRLVAHVREKVRTGDPRDRNVINGPMIEPGAQQRVLKMIDNAVAAGARLLCGGRAAGPCIEPAILENVPASHDLVAEEAFAPVAVLIPYDDFADALRLANASRYGLQAGVFTRDAALAERAFAELEVGAVLINQVPTFRLDPLPYGGVKDSGFGREGPRWAIEEMTEVRVRIERGRL